MNESTDDLINVEAVKFLERDFNQCFDQLRHYDNQICGICKFAFTAYAALLGIAIGFYKYKTEMIGTSIVILGVGVLVGLVLFALVIRDRVYFVRVARYINEHRRHFLRVRPLGFENITKMFDDPNYPPYFDWKSSQAWASHITAFLNSTLFGACVFMMMRGNEWKYHLASVSFLLLLVAQITHAMLHLRSCEKLAKEGINKGKG